MPSDFLNNLNLRTLIAPISEEEFRSKFWEKRPLIVLRNDTSYYGDLFTIDDFDDAITRTPDYVKMANATSRKNVSYKSESARGIESVIEDMRNGGTLVLDQMNKSNPKLAMLCRALIPEMGHRFQTNLYLTPPHGQGFSPHWDNHDVFILQVLGSKHWKIEKQRRVLNLKSDKMGDEGRELRGELEQFTLGQGDLIYIPRGFVHAAECGDEPSLHITFGVTGVFWEDLLQACIRFALIRDERLRATLPLGFHRGDAHKAVVTRLKGIFRELSDEQFLGEAVGQFMDEIVQTYPLDTAGLIKQFFQRKELHLDTLVCPRRAIVYQSHVLPDMVRLNYGARTVDFLALFGEALDYALTTQSYLVRDLPGHLQEEEKIALVERLIEEGLVIRKEPLA
jgi:ribosomal protein L16 Arg81 hydroxylase